MHLDGLELKKQYQTYLPVVLSLEKKYYIPGWDHEDWLQEGFVSFYQTLQTFDAGKGPTLGAYFKLNFNRRLISEVRYFNAAKRRSGQPLIPLEEAGLHETVADYQALQPFYQETFADFTGKLSFQELEALAHYLMRSPINEAEESSQRRILYRVRSKLKRHLQEGEY